MTNFSFANLSAKDTFKKLGVKSHGLNSNEVERRLAKYGYNVVNSSSLNWFKILLRQFKSPFIYLQILAVIISFWLNETNNGILISIFTLINIVLGFTQEYKAQKAASLLKELLPEKVTVQRDGREKLVEKRELVLGDVVILRAGVVVPADLRLTAVNNLLIDESTLTGESVPVNKILKKLLKPTKEILDIKNMAFAGTMVLSGEGRGLVVATGYNTELGEISQTLQKVDRESSYEKDLLSFSKLILRIIISTILLIFILNIAVKGSENFYDFFVFCIALIVGIVPEALPVVVSWSLSQGAIKLAREKVIVKRLSAIEDLGNVQILCSDKTGTLTENHLTFKKIISHNPDLCWQYAILASQDNQVKDNPFAKALNEIAKPKIMADAKKFHIVDRLPFDSIRMRSSVLVEDAKGKNILISWGAPEKILAVCSRFASNHEKNKILSEINWFGRKGYRTLAVAYKKIKSSRSAKDQEKNLVFSGFFVFHDPLKKTTKETIGLAQKMGLKIKIITGDSIEVATQVAKKIGLIKNDKQVILGDDLEDLSEKEFDRACRQYEVFARINPLTKLKIVQSLQKDKEVGFFGDGINDAPALKSSNLAISADSATDVAREVSDIILLKKDLKVIVDGVKQGRNIYANINKYIKCTLASNFGNSYSLAIISLLIPYLPMLAIQLLLVNLISDFPLIAVASDSVDAEELRRPKAYQLSQTIHLVIGLAIISSVFDVLFFLIFKKSGEHVLQSLWFMESVLTEIALIYSIRTTHWFWQAKLPGRPLIFFSFIAFLTTIILPFTVFGQTIFYFISPNLIQVAIVFGLVAMYFLSSELYKHYYYRKNGNHQIKKLI